MKELLKRKNYLIIGISMLLVLVLGLTYAYFTGSLLNRNGSMVVTSGLVDFNLTNERVNVTDLMPIYDSDYETSAYKHTFTVQRKSNSNLGACYSLSLVVDSIGSNIANEYLKYKLVYGNTVSEGNFSNVSAGDTITLLTNQSYSTSDTSSKEYVLYIWLSYSETEDQTSMLTGAASTRTLESHLEMNGSTNECIDSNIPVTAYTLNGESTDESYSSLYNKLGDEYEAEVTCTNGSVYTYNSSTNTIDLVTLRVPDACTINFKKIDADVNMIAWTFKGESTNLSYSALYSSPAYVIDSISCTKGSAILGNEDNAIIVTEMPAQCTVDFGDKTYIVAGASNDSSFGTITSSTVTYGGTTTLTITPESGYYLTAFSCTNGYTYSGVNIGSSYTSAQTATISNNNQASGTTCTATFTSPGCTVNLKGSSSARADYYCENGIGTMTACYFNDRQCVGSNWSAMCTLGAGFFAEPKIYCNSSYVSGRYYGGGMSETISCSCG